MLTVGAYILAYFISNMKHKLAGNTLIDIGKNSIIYLGFHQLAGTFWYILTGFLPISLRGATRSALMSLLILITCKIAQQIINRNRMLTRLITGRKKGCDFDEISNWGVIKVSVTLICKLFWGHKIGEAQSILIRML